LLLYKLKLLSLHFEDNKDRFNKPRNKEYLVSLFGDLVYGIRFSPESREELTELAKRVYNLSDKHKNTGAMFWKERLEEDKSLLGGFSLC